MRIFFLRASKKILPIFKVINTVKLCSNNQLQRNCSYTTVWDLPCVHPFCITNTFTSTLWNGVSHNDVSVIWWKSYYLYSLPEIVDPDPEKQEKIKLIFHTLREKEKVGIFVSKDVLMILIPPSFQQMK